VKEGQRVISTFGNSPMGYAFPAAIGAAFARPGKQIICIDGDGGFQPNIQELQTVAHYKLPLKIFILNNRSMGIIKQFQDAYFGGRYHASAPEGDYTMPDFQAIARAYGIDAMTVDKQEGMQKAIQSALAHEGPILVNVLIDTAQKLNPKLEFGRPLEDMCPYLSDEEFYANLLVKPVPRMKEQRGWQQAE
ncbi:MAG: thiamine pyrophosphate-binding protein, partial [Candidatus Liptonbacteria bacterium]|nr:thiamine pyrophosphate-binding protein [Candidatus Liptonbacteria bacterium]